MDELTLDKGRLRLQQIFQYLKALHERRNPPVRRVVEHPYHLWLSDLPQHACIERDLDNSVLRVTRPRRTEPPTPPEPLRPWLKPGWDGPETEPQVRDSLPATHEGDEPERFDASSQRVAAWTAWQEEWHAWAPLARVDRQVERVYQALYEQRSILERDAERFELVIGDGLVNWRLPEGGADHPLLLKRVELEFDAKNAAFTIVESDWPVEFYTPPLRSASVTATTLAAIRQQVEGAEWLHPLEEEATTDFLKGVATSLHREGEFLETRQIAGETDHPRLYRRLVLIRRSKALGLGQAIEQVLETLPTREDLPVGMLRIAGIDPDETAAAEGEQGSSTTDDDDDTYFTKAANVEQLRIVRRLRASGCVLVQGPPGTGKTHTIGNLIGHLLAEGKSVLVTSQTTKALSVVKQQVVPALQPLCVSVLQSDRASRDELEQSVQSIAERLSVNDGSLERAIPQLEARRAELSRRIGELRERLRAVRRSEQELISFGGETYRPTDAARLVAEHRDRDGWILGAVTPRFLLPLRREELAELYASNMAISAEDEENLPESLPDTSTVLAPEQYRDLISSVTELRLRDTAVPDSLCRPVSCSAPDIAAAIDQVRQCLDPLSGEESGWLLALVDLGRRGDDSIWRSLVERTSQVSAQVAACKEAVLAVGPTWTPGMPPDEAIATCREIAQHLAAGGRLDPLTLLWRGSWKRVKENLKVADGVPRHADHFRIAADALEVERQRAELRRIWNGLAQEIGGPGVPAEESSPERWASSLTADIVAALEWHGTEWRTLSTTVEAVGLLVERAIASVPPSTGATAELDRLVRGVREVILPNLERLNARALLRESEVALAHNLKAVAALQAAHPTVPLLQDLMDAVRSEDTVAYETSFEALAAVYRKNPLVQRRRELLARLQEHAPEWALAIRSRLHMHGAAELPGDPEAAWLWKQLDQELTERARVSLQQLVRSLSDAKREREEVTTALVDRRAWNGQFGRVTLPMRQALIGFVETLRRIGAGTGRRVPRLLLQAQEQMRNAQGAVPVWIMPLNRVAETFDLRTTRFNVVIIDEASQLDLTGLLALSIADEVVIVGDHEQVEPLAVGERTEDVQALIDEHLTGIPNAQLWDGKQSVYGLARQSFEPIPLREHFRCVPQIIAFSNRLSYNGSILPLREESEVSTRPFVVAHHVKGGYYDRYRNTREAEELVALMVAAAEQPEYAGKSFGVISMVGDDNSPHVRLLQTLAVQRLGAEECEARRLRCGNSAQFQGDERDVMFLSMVDGPTEGGPHPLRSQDLYKKRFNVAASRARDQMWVVYSMDPDLDLQPTDLRKQLIDHARDPGALERLYEDRAPATESDFEQRVLRALLTCGYTQVQPQYRAGAYRIDFAIKQERLRIAIECDGDRFHTLDELDRDLDRQATLERCGWQFVRIRGSEFYRDPEATMTRVARELQQLGVSPAHGGAPTAAESDLLIRVRTRAAELLREWNGSVETESAPSCGELQETSEGLTVDGPAADRGATTGAPQPEDILRPIIPTAFAPTVQRQLDLGLSAAPAPTGQPVVDPADAIRAVLRHHRSLSRDDLLEECARLMPEQRLSRSVRSALNQALGRLSRTGEVRIDSSWTTVELSGDR